MIDAQDGTAGLPGKGSPITAKGPGRVTAAPACSVPA
jgi:hypothetical protein